MVVSGDVAGRFKMLRTARAYPRKDAGDTAHVTKLLRTSLVITIRIGCTTIDQVIVRDAGNDRCMLHAACTVDRQYFACPTHRRSLMRPYPLNSFNHPL